MCMRSSADKAKHLKGRYVARKEEDKTEAATLPPIIPSIALATAYSTIIP